MFVSVGLLAAGWGCTWGRTGVFHLYPPITSLVPAAARAIPEQPGVRPVPGGSLRVALTGLPEGVFNPILAYTEADRQVCDVIFEGLVRLTEDLRPGPGLAERWEVSQDGREITFHLRPGLRWHDGQPVTAADVEFTIWSILHPRYQGPLYPDFQDIEGATEFHDGRREYIAGVKVRDSSTISIKTVVPYSLILTRLTVGILPRHLLGLIPPEKLPQSGFNSNPIGCGPFAIVYHEPGRYVELRAFEGYFLGRPLLERLVFKVIRGQDVASAFERGDIDVARLELPYSKEEAESTLSRLRTIPGVRMINSPSAAYQYIGLNLDLDLFKDESVRQALMYGINRTEMAKTAFYGFGRPLNGPFPSCFRFGNTVELSEYQFDPAMASLLLREGGWLDQDGDGILEKDGRKFKFTLAYPSDDLRRELAQMVQRDLGAVGVGVELEELKLEELRTTVFDERKFESFLVGMRMPVGLDVRDVWHSSRVSPLGWNAAGYKSLESDRLLDLAIASVDVRNMTQAYDRWYSLLNEQVPCLFLVEEDEMLAVRSSAGGIRPVASDLTWNVHEWWSPSD